MIRPIRLYGVGEAGITARNNEGEIKHQYGFHECCSFIVVKNKGSEARLDSGVTCVQVFFALYNALSVFPRRITSACSI